MKVCFASLVPGPGQQNTDVGTPVWWGCGSESNTDGETSGTAILKSQWPLTLNVPHNEDGFSIARLGERIYLSGDPVPPSPVYLIGTRIKAFSPDFNARRRNGEIVLNPYFISEIIATPYDSFVINDEGPCPWWVDRSMMLDLSNFNVPKAPAPCNNYYRVGGQNIYSFTHYQRRHGTVSRVASPWDYVTEQQVRSYFETYTNTLDNPNLVQDVLADLNARSVDFLTSVMELPETIVSMGEILRGCKRMIQRFISKKSRIEKAADARRTFFLANSKAISLAIHRLEIQLEGLGFGKKRNRILSRIRFLRKQSKANDKSYKNVAVEMSTALSSLWLKLRYEIMPNIYLAEDLADTAKKRTTIFQTGRGKYITDGWLPQFPGFECSGSVSTTFKFMAKYGYSPYDTTMSELKRAFSANPFLTAWELGRLTFVLDWFFSVGSMLSAKFGKPSLAVQQGFFLTQKNVINLVYTHSATGCKFTVSGSNYRASPVFLEEFLGIFPLINLNWKRLVDSSALMWGEIKRHFKLK